MQFEASLRGEVGSASENLVEENLMYFTPCVIFSLHVFSTLQKMTTRPSLALELAVIHARASERERSSVNTRAREYARVRLRQKCRLCRKGNVRGVRT